MVQALGVLPEKFGGASQNSYRIYDQICDFSYPIYDQTKNWIPYL